MPAPSPSPVNTVVTRSLLKDFAPVAKASALPWVVCRVSPLKFGLGIHAEHPMPETHRTFSFGIPSSSMALTKQLRMVPSPQPTQKAEG